MFKMLSAVLFAGSLAFAQSDDLFSDDFQDAATADSIAHANAEATTQANEAAAQANIGNAKATSGQWDGFNYEDMGLTQWEYQQAKEQGVTREKLTKLVEIGIRPTEYLQKPWNRLGVSEEDWLSQRAEGMEDADIDRSYRYHSGDQKSAYLSLLIPSYYQWKTHAVAKATFMDVLEVGSIAVTIVLKVQDKSYWWYGFLGIAAAHLWSFADAFISTQWDSNPDANRFSFGVIPTPDKGVASFFNVKF
jgi:hypothetical protein